jgi:hypothetical protein
VSDWLDFGLYALQAVMLWIVVPAWGTWFLRPLQLRTGVWVKVLRGWGVLSVAALLFANGWESLLRISYLMLALGVLLAGYGVWTFLRWLKSNEPELQAEETFPLTRDDFLPRELQYVIYGLLLVALLARPLAGLVWPGVQDIWGNFLTVLVVAMLLFLSASGSVMRTPNHLDLALGPRFRQMEVRICYLLMGCLALLQIASLSLELAGLASRRNGALLVSAFVSLTLGGFMLLSSPGKEKGPAVSSRP